MKQYLNPDAEISQYIVAGDKIFPNNGDLPVLVYKSVFNLPEEGAAEFITEIFKENKWKNAWTNGVFNYHHYHSTAHEVLAISRGNCMLLLGGDDGIITTLKQGDVLVLPAGVAHKNVGASEDFECVGAYPKGQDFDIMLGKPEERKKADKNIKKLNLPRRDPVMGRKGPVLEHWKNDESKKVTETAAQF